MNLIAYVFVIIGILGLFFAILKSCLVIAQQSEYRLKDMLFTYGGKQVYAALLLLLGYFILVTIFGAAGVVAPERFIPIIPFALLGLWVGVRVYRQELKKPFVWTQKIKLIAGVTSVFYVGGLVCTYLLYGQSDDGESFFLIFWMLGSFVLFILPLVVTIFFEFTKPLQTIIERKKKAELEGLLKNKTTTIIGIAGSYGKTSTKYFLAQILKEKYTTEMTQGSYNTLLGVISEVSKKIKSNPDMFVIEMGAYKRGEVKEIAELVKPTIGILTALGPEHFERFGSMEEIEKAEFEIIEALPQNGVAVVNTDSDSGKKLFSQTTQEKKQSVSQADIASYTTSKEGTTFAITGMQAEFHTKVLGRLAVVNIIAALKVARHLGMSEEQLVQAVAKLTPAPHRLELIQNGAVTVIDDAYNSNPKGAAEALEVLSSFSGRKILVTPGMIELGVKQFEENKIFGTKAGQVCDVVVVVNKTNREALKEGVENGKATLHTFNTLEEASAWIRQNSLAGDNILFENDLPDIYQ